MKRSGRRQIAVTINQTNLATARPKRVSNHRGGLANRRFASACSGRSLTTITSRTPQRTNQAPKTKQTCLNEAEPLANPLLHSRFEHRDEANVAAVLGRVSCDRSRSDGVAQNGGTDLIAGTTDTIAVDPPANQPVEAE